LLLISAEREEGPVSGSGLAQPTTARTVKRGAREAVMMRGLRRKACRP
jgi:hypothetical protein